MSLSIVHLLARCWPLEERTRLCIRVSKDIPGEAEEAIDGSARPNKNVQLVKSRERCSGWCEDCGLSSGAPKPDEAWSLFPAQLCSSINNNLSMRPLSSKMMT